MKETVMTQVLAQTLTTKKEKVPGHAGFGIFVQ